MTAPAGIEFTIHDVKGALSQVPDDASVVLGAALLHSALGRLFERRLGAESHELLSNGAPIGAFPTRIQLAHGLGWIDNDTCDDLARVHTIREETTPAIGSKPFARAIAFERCAGFNVAEALFGRVPPDAPGMHDGMTVIQTPIGDEAAQVARHRFEVTVELLEQRLDGL
ncbi:hypothetical protein ACG02S_01030 [Roseateles sp. DC23W]|uniref:Uncharacterized protein n=1 Tax=Pelomonas dachongensis TaxID=3299029 RepID=A0ABW7EGI7_9BURK